MYTLDDIPLNSYKDGELVPYTLEEREELLTQWNADLERIDLHNSTKYKRDRAAEYPPLADLADAMYWSSQGDNTKLEAYYAACEAVKQKYPKVS